VTVMQVMGLKPLMETPLKKDYIAHDKPRMARLLGVPMVQPDMQGMSSVNAQRAYLWLLDQQPTAARRFAHGAFQRLWVHGQGITQDEDLRQLCDAVDVDAAAVLQAIRADSAKQALREAVDQAIARGVFGTPFFIVDNEPIWGVDRLWMIEHWLSHGRWERAD